MPVTNHSLFKFKNITSLRLRTLPASSTDSLVISSYTCQEKTNSRRLVAYLQSVAFTALTTTILSHFTKVNIYFKMFSNAVAFTGLVSVASAHILMTNPVPFSGTVSSPLDGSGSNFPCQAVSYGGSGGNTYAQGSTQQLSFKGTAVHGGGSCQVSVTTDTNPTANSVWKVIKSIEGGCPAQDQPGNMGNDANAEVPYKYDFTIPTDLAAGEYVFAWTWFNKIGNREMYMNCAPVTVTGSGGDANLLSSLPDMFVANTGDGCTTTESTDLKFPDPGAAVEQLNGATSVFAGPVGSCPTGSSGGPPPSQPSAVNPELTASATPTPQPNIPGGVFVPVDPSNGTTSTSAAAAPTAAPEAPVASPEAPVVEAPVADAPGAAPSGTPAGSPCATEGNWNCVGGSAFQRCASGVWSPIQQLSAGTSCTGGVGTTLNFVKRSGSFTHRASRHRALHRAMRAAKN